MRWKLSEDHQRAIAAYRRKRQRRRPLVKRKRRARRVSVDRRSERMRALWRDPIYRARMMVGLRAGWAYMTQFRFAPPVYNGPRSRRSL